jgi:transcriptional regulator with XRE-family HTH domain
VPQERTQVAFPEALPGLLRDRGMSVRQLALAAGVTSQHLSRIIRRRDNKRVSPELAGAVAVELGLPRDYFPEYREGVVLESIRRDPDLLDKVYTLVTRRRDR